MLENRIIVSALIYRMIFRSHVLNMNDRSYKGDYSEKT